MGETTPQEVIIRPATMQDAEAIYQIGILCFSDAWKKETVVHDLKQPLSHYWVVETEKGVSAYACFWFVVDELQLVNIAVHPSMQRKGLADKLILQGVIDAKEHGMKTMSLEVRVSNIAAQTLYRKHELSVIALRKGAYQLPKEDGYIMSRTL